MSWPRRSSPARRYRNKWRSRRSRLPVQPEARSPQPEMRTNSAAHDFCAALTDFLESSPLTTAVFFRQWSAPHSKIAGHRLRDLFPIPPVRSWPENVPLHGDAQLCMKVTNMCLGALLAHWLESRFSEWAHACFSIQCAEIHPQACLWPSVSFSSPIEWSLRAQPALEKSLFSLREHDTPQYVDISRSAVDLPSTAGTSDPLQPGVRGCAL